ncbi:MAG: hypothetical protein HY753_06455 [Nitrospirae bacterium]|nr:hypothetical protein [Nitrospirota bacterium]
MVKSKTKKVFFKDVVRACGFKNVKEALLRLYPNQKKNIKGYKYVFQTLRLMSLRYSKERMVIDVSRLGRGRKAYFSVSGVCTEKGIKQSYAIEYMPWSEWLGCEVDKQVFKKMPKEEIAAHCLWEMTFMGFTQDKIRKKLNALKKQSRDIKEGKVKTIPFEEVMLRLKSKIKLHRLKNKVAVISPGRIRISPLP